MLKGFEYNKDYKKIGCRSIYEQEYELLHDFSASEHKTIRFEYSTEREAVNARQCCNSYVKKAKMPLRVIQRERYVFVLKTREN